MATAAEIADLITQGMQGPSGADDSGWHVGRILSWDSGTGLNSVLVNGATLTNLKALTPSIGTEYGPGQSVLIVRKQTQYFILGPVTTPGSVGSTPPNQVDGIGSGITGATDVWRDLDTPASSPTMTVKLAPYQRCLFMWGAADVWTIGTEVEGTLTITSPGGQNMMAQPYSFVGSRWRFGQGISSTQATRGPVFKTFLVKVAGSDSTPSENAVMPGNNLVAVKYRVHVNTGTGNSAVNNPWILAIPF